MMYVIPAIDLRKGKCVRLIQGEYHKQITYQNDPVEQAKQFEAAGAQWLHVIDLDGAKIGKPVNSEIIKTITSASGMKVEVGGGIRSEETIKQMLDIGVERVIVGTKAINEFDWFHDMANKFAGKIVLGLDARGSKIAIQGWTEESTQKILEFALKAAKLPLAAIIYTDIDKDGMLAGPNFEQTETIAESVNIPVIASGGVTKISDVEKLAQSGVISGAIIGRALYEGTIDLAEAIKAAEYATE